MPERFISESIKPVAETADTARMAAGEPGLPQCFHWRKREVEIVQILRSWRETGPCRHGSGEQYVRKHWFEVLTSQDERMKIYFERQPRPGKRPTARWWLFSIETADTAPGA